jgi:hypothetical protein
MSTQAEKDKIKRDVGVRRALDAAKKAAEEKEARREAIEKNIAELKAKQKKLTDEISKLEKFNDGYVKNLATLDENDPLDAANITLLTNLILANNKKIKQYIDEKKVLATKIKTKQWELNKKTAGAIGSTNPTPNTSTNGNNNSRINETNNGGGADDWKKGWNYNAPLVKSAYFNSVSGIASSLQGKSIEGLYIDQGNFTDALEAWKNGKGGRGTIQMDRSARTSILEAQGDKTGILDKKMYGFKFLYNPKEVAMAWGIMDQMDPEFVASGQDAFSAISAGLMASSVSITILLNRMEDDNYLNPNGTFRNEINPYPISVPLEDRQEIWQKGTMYDLEYLFRTLNGPRAKFTSKLNGSTSDRGWLRPSIVELHLGLRMRYRVRVQNLQVAHTIFNERMVPILTSVKLDLGRFNDGPGHTVSQKTADLATSTYGTGSGGYIGGTYYGPEEYNRIKPKG